MARYPQAILMSCEIPWDENVLKSLARKRPLVELRDISPAAISYFELASKVTGLKYKKPLFLDLRRFFAPRFQIR